MVHTRFDHMPKALHANNRKEYVNQALITWCSKQGIQLQFIAPYTPQQNGVAKRFNQTLVELARAMQEAKNLPESLWLTTIAHAAYLRNRAFTNALKTMTPYEHWHLKKPGVTHLREYGSPVIILIEGINVPKLNLKAQEHLFVGFDDETSSVKYFDRQTKQVKHSCNYCFIHPQSEGELGLGTLSGGSGGRADEDLMKKKQQ